MFSSGPKLQVNPHFSTDPATVILLLTEIPAKAGVACFALDGDNYYGGCQYIEGRRSIRVEYKDVRQGNYVALATIDDKIVSEQPVSIIGIGGRMDDDGRDELIKKRYKNDSLVAKPEAIDTIIQRYTDPWLPAYYSQYDDVRINVCYHQTCVEGIHGFQNWIIPVHEAQKVKGGYDQKRVGIIEISSIPDYETGEFDIGIRITEPWED